MFRISTVDSQEFRVAPSLRGCRRSVKRGLSSVTPAVALLCGILTGCAPDRIAATVRVSISGAQIPVELVSSWLDRAKQPHFSLMPVSPVYLSQHGFAALKRGEADIACTDRPIAPSELAEFKDQKPKGLRVAYYGFALYVNLENTLDSIFAGHIKLLFQKKMTDWKQLGAKEGPIHLYGPRKSTRGGDLLSKQSKIFMTDPTWEVLDSGDEIIRRVINDPFALGFAPIGLDGEVRYLGLRMERESDPVLPALEDIENGNYGLAKVIYVYFAQPANPSSTAVVDYLFSDAGQAAIRATDVNPIPRPRAVVEVRPP